MFSLEDTCQLITLSFTSQLACHPIIVERAGFPHHPVMILTTLFASFLTAVSTVYAAQSFAPLPGLWNSKGISDWLLFIGLCP